MGDSVKTWDISALRWKWKFLYNWFTVNVDSYQMKEWLQFSGTGNQANIRFLEFCVNYYITLTVVFLYIGCNYLVCNSLDTM